MTEQCSLCRYFRLQFENQGAGFCRRFPPFPDGFPGVITTEWCGEFSSAAAAEKAEAAGILKDANERFVPNAVFLAPDSQGPTAHERNKTRCEDCEQYHSPAGLCKSCKGGDLYLLAKHLEPKPAPDKCASCRFFMKPEQGICTGCHDHALFEGIKNE